MSQPNTRTRRPVLAPGLHVLQRKRGELQIGLGEAVRVRLPDTEPVRRTLGHLLRGEAVPPDPDTEATLAALAPVLVEGAGLLAPDAAPGDVAAIALLDPHGYTSRLASRRAAHVTVSGSLGSAGVDPRPLLAAAGLRVVDSPRAAGSRTARAALVLCAGELDRAELDPLLRDRVPHVVVRLVEGAALVGPFVEAGSTACLRCIDTHRAVDDPQSVALVTRHSLARLDRLDGVAEPVDSALATLAVAWAVRDLVTHAEGDRPSTWSATVRLSAALASVTHTEWLRHPACGCNWVPDEQASRTMVW